MKSKLDEWVERHPDQPKKWRIASIMAGGKTKKQAEEQYVLEQQDINLTEIGGK
jgi:hypothetical protein